jgi:hypothetical protein
MCLQEFAIFLLGKLFFHLANYFFTYTFASGTLMYFFILFTLPPHFIQGKTQMTSRVRVRIFARSSQIFSLVGKKCQVFSVFVENQECQSNLVTVRRSIKCELMTKFIS